MENVRYYVAAVCIIVALYNLGIVVAIGIRRAKRQAAMRLAINDNQRIVFDIMVKDQVPFNCKIPELTIAMYALNCDGLLTKEERIEFIRLWSGVGSYDGTIKSIPPLKNAYVPK